MANTGSGPDRLREYLRTHKRDGATWNALGSTLRGYIRDGVPERPIDRTFARVDRLLRWEPGSAQRVFEGGEPVPLPPDPDSTPSISPLEFAENELRSARVAIGNALDALSLHMRSTAEGSEVAEFGD